jgi:hypothetical protein
MEPMTESWTDARLYDFAKHVDQRFDAVDASLREINARFEGLQKLMFQASVLVIVALIGLIATQL